MATEVPVRCVVTLTLTFDIDVSEKTAVKTKLSQLMNNVKTEFPDKVTENRIHIKSEFAEEAWSV